MRINMYAAVSLLTVMTVSPLPGQCGIAGDRNPAFTGTTLPQTSSPARGAVFPETLELRIGESSQILLVRNADPASVDVLITALEKIQGRWRSPLAAMNGVIGRSGFALPGEKREGDGRTPSGIFPLGLVFGYAPSFPTRMPYRQATADDLWVDDVQADDYNQWVRKGTTKAGSFERMKRDDDLYKLGIVVEYNTNPVVKGLGSAIFIHIWKEKGMPTAGCIALSENDLAKIVKWLDPAAAPLLLLTNDISPPEGIVR